MKCEIETTEVSEYKLHEREFVSTVAIRPEC